MSLRSSVCIFVCLIAALNAWAAPPDHPRDFWNTPGEIIRDASGKVLYQEVKDPASFTMRVQHNGAWFTYRFHPHTERIARIDAPDTVEEYQYDKNANWEGIRVQANGRRLTFVAPVDQASITGLPSLTAVRDSLGRQRAWRSGSDTVMSIAYDEDGTPQIELGALKLSLSSDKGAIVQTLTGPAGVLATTTPRGRKSKREFRFSLDAVAAELGLGEDWSNRIETKRSSTGTLVTLTQRNNGDALAYLVRHGGSVAAFDAGGEPLFYDLALDYSEKSAPTGGDAMAPDIATRLAGVLPSRMIVTARGDIGMYVERPEDGAIQSVWIRQRDGRTTYSHRLFQSGMHRHVLDAPERRRYDPRCGPDGKRIFGEEVAERGNLDPQRRLRRRLLQRHRECVDHDRRYQGLRLRQLQESDDGPGRGAPDPRGPAHSGTSGESAVHLGDVIVTNQHDGGAELR